MCCPKGRLFWSENGRDFAHFGLESGMVYKGTTVVYECVSYFNYKWKRKKERKKEIFCSHSKLSSGDIISVNVKKNVAFCDHLQVWKWVWKMTFLVWNRVRIRITRRHSPTKNSQKYYPPLRLWTEPKVFRMLMERKDVWVKALKERK